MLGVTVNAAVAPEIGSGLVGVRLRRFATLVAELIMTKTMYGDTIVRLRRQAGMGLAAEMQWSLRDGRFRQRRCTWRPRGQRLAVGPRAEGGRT